MQPKGAPVFVSLFIVTATGQALWLPLAFLLEALYRPNTANQTQNITFTLRKSVSNNT
jgi:hypothetical protein